jgi:hypothetical protein
MNASSFLDLIPSFVSGAQALHGELVGVCFVLSVAGLIIHTVHALVSKNLGVMFPTLVRLTVVAILVGSLQTWADMLVTGVQGLQQDLGASGGFDIFQDYQAAIARKLGTAAAIQNFSQTPSAQSFAPTEGDTSGGYEPQSTPTTGVILTHYAYPGDSTPDHYSENGEGAFPFSSAPGSLIPGYSAALTASAAAAYNIQPGQSFSVTTSGGQTYNLVYADVAPESDQRVDIYDPNGQLPGGNDFSQSVTSISGGPIVQGQTGLASLMPNPGGNIQDQILWAITLVLSWIASAIMFLMTIAQKLLYLIEIAISPIFIGFLMIPALTYLARRFFLILVALTLWPLAWGVCNLISKAIIDLGVNVGNNSALSLGSGLAQGLGPLAGFGFLIVLAVWVIGSTIAAPLFVNYLLAAGGAGATGAVFGATLGAAASQAATTSWRSIGGIGGVASLVNGVMGGRPISARSASLMSPTQSYARRPMNTETAKES